MAAKTRPRRARKPTKPKSSPTRKKTTKKTTTTKTTRKKTTTTATQKPKPSAHAATSSRAATPPSQTEGIPFPFFGAGDASYFEWADLHVYFARDVKPAEKGKVTKTVPPPIDDVEWDGRHLYLSSDQGVGRQIQAAYSKPPKQPTMLTTTSRFKIPDGPKLSAFNADIERYLLEVHEIVPILAAFRRQDHEAGGTQLSPWHAQSLPHGDAVLKQLKPEAGAALEYMVRGIRSELERTKKKK